MNLTYIIPDLFGRKIQTQLKDYLFSKRHPYALRIIYFLNHNAHIHLRELNILKLPPENCVFWNKYCNKCLPIIFENWFTLSSDFHTCNTRWSNIGCIVVPPHNTKRYGRNSVNISAVCAWKIIYRNQMKIIFFVNSTK